MSYFSSLLIPKERIKILIGRQGSIQKRIEKGTNVKLFIHSDEAKVDINSEDAICAMNAENVIKAIGRGFEPKIAFKLFNEDYIIEVIYFSDFKAKSKSKKEVLKSRIIGAKGTTKRIIEQYTDSDLCIFGKTVSIITKLDNLFFVKKAVEMILSGANHRTVYHFLQESAQK